MWRFQMPIFKEQCITSAGIVRTTYAALRGVEVDGFGRFAAATFHGTALRGDVVDIVFFRRLRKRFPAVRDIKVDLAQLLAEWVVLGLQRVFLGLVVLFSERGREMREGRIVSISPL